MKDEEMAEEYANNIDYTKTVKIFDFVPYHENCDVADMVAQAFLAGLKADRPQWHDLRKDPNDLPPRMVSNPNFSIKVLSDEGEIVCYNFHYCEWFYWRSWRPIAWCEIPTFDKE